MTILAEATTTATETTGNGDPAPTGWEQYSTWIFIAVFAALFYFLLIRPGQKQRKTHQQLVASVGKGDEVMTAGGVYGTVAKVRDDYIMLEVANKTVIKVSKSSVARVTSSTEAEEPDEDFEEEPTSDAEEAQASGESGDEK